MPTTTVQTPPVTPDQLANLRQRYRYWTDQDDRLAMIGEKPASRACRFAIAGIIGATSALLEVPEIAAVFILEGEADPTMAP